MKTPPLHLRSAGLLPQVARAIDEVATAIRAGGRLIYVGAGTSGRLGALDASEIPPTFNTNPRTIQYVMAGGSKALGSSTEASEDDTQARRRRNEKAQARKARCRPRHRHQRTHSLHHRRR